MKIFAIVFAAPVLLFTLTTSLSASRPAPAPSVPNVSTVYFQTRTPAIIAHRGAADEEARRNGFHEGTLEAYRYAAGLGVEVLEMDVHVTTDRRLLVHHDDKLPAACAGQDRISRLSAGQVKACRAGLGYEIPELREIFTSFPRTRMTIEMKTPGNSLTGSYTGIAALLWNEIRSHGMERTVSVSSVSGSSTKEFRGLVNGIPTGLSAGEQVSFLLCYLARLPGWACAGVPRDANHLLETPFVHKELEFLGVSLPIFSLVSDSFVGQARAYQYRLNYWTVNKPDDIRRVFAVRADGVITDNPGLARIAVRYLWDENAYAQRWYS